MVWHEGPFNQVGWGQVLAADDGVVTNLDGGCGRGGEAHASCSITGNSGFALRLRHAEPNAPAWLVLSGSRLSQGLGVRARALCFPTQRPGWCWAWETPMPRATPPSCSRCLPTPGSSGSSCTSSG